MIKKWKEFKINESNHFLELKEMIEDIKDILIELEDNDIPYQIHPENDISLKKLSLSMRRLIFKKEHFFIRIESELDLKKQWLIATLRQLESYLKSNNFKLQYILSNSIFSEIKNYNNIDSILDNHDKLDIVEIFILY
jgi:hypothetical protein